VGRCDHYGEDSASIKGNITQKEFMRKQNRLTILLVHKFFLGDTKGTFGGIGASGL
jgi:hypothetical protein